MKIEALWQLAGQSGTEEFTGTNDVKLLPANKRKICDPKDQYFFGQITNLSNDDIRLSVALHNVSSGVHTHDLRAKETLNIKGLPVDYIGVVVNGTVAVHGMGVIVNLTEQELLNVLGQIGLYEDLHDFRYYGFPETAHTDINSATTTTLATPASGKTLRIYKITLSSQGAVNGLVVETTTSAGASAHIIGTINFPSAGTWVYDFGDRGWECPNGANGLLKLISVDATVLDVDVVYEDVDLQ